MNTIINRRQLNEAVVLLEVKAPFIAKKAQAGQFVIVRVDEKGERFPLTIADYDATKGTITIMFQTIGRSTKLLGELAVGEAILDLVGPLGVPTHMKEGVKKVCVVGGGVGCAIAFPQAKSLFQKGCTVDVIAGFRNKDIVILEEEFRENSSNLYITTDDGSYAEKGFVTDKLKSLIDSGNKYDLVIAIGPVPMMKFVCKVAEPYGIDAIVSLNPIMIDGTGMCGCCRVKVGGETKFACVDGPDFDGHKVDFDELMRRNSIYKEQEKKDMENHVCKLTRGAEHA